MHPDIEKLVESGKLPREAGDFLSELEPGTYCEHKSWGYGKVAAWDLLGDRIKIDFDEKPGHPMKLEFAARSVKPLPEGHVMTLYLSDPEGVRKMAKDETTEFVRLVLESQGGSTSLALSCLPTAEILSNCGMLASRRPKLLRLTLRQWVI